MRRMMTDKEIATVDALRKDGILSLKDSHGNPRFVEGDITMNTIEGVTQTYGKWSLSGTHLMITIVFTTDADTVLPTNRAIVIITVPQFILDKITPLEENEYVDAKTFIMRGTPNWWQTTYNLPLLLNKNPNYLYIATTTNNPTIRTNCVTRVQFDLLIDADYDE